MRFMLLQNYGRIEGCRADERVDAGGDPGAHHVPAPDQRRADRARRTDRRPGADRTRGGQARDLWRYRRPGRHGRSLSPSTRSCSPATGSSTSNRSSGRSRSRPRCPPRRVRTPPRSSSRSSCGRSWPRSVPRRELRGVTTSPQPVEDPLRDAAPRVLGALVRRYGNFADAEDAVQEALLAAATQWPSQGTPEQPGGLAGPGGLATPDRPASQRRARARSARTAYERWEPPSPSAPGPGRHGDPDVHVRPSGTHHELGHRAHAARGGRSDHGRDRHGPSWFPKRRWPSGSAGPRQSIKAVGRPVRDAARAECAERLASVLHVLYLIFNEGYAGRQWRPSWLGPTSRARRSG